MCVVLIQRTLMSAAMLLLLITVCYLFTGSPCISQKDSSKQMGFHHNAGRRTG